MFSLCSLILGPQPPPPPPPASLTLEIHPPPSQPPLDCGPGGAGACCPEDRGSAGSQKHLSVPLPLHCKPPGTALSQPAPALCAYVRVLATAVCACVCVHESVSACLPLSLNTPSWVWLWTHGLINMAAAPPHPQSRHLFSPHIWNLLLTWLNASRSHPRLAASSSRLTPPGTGVLCLDSPLPLLCMLGNIHVVRSGLHEHECDWERLTLDSSWGGIWMRLTQM